MTGVQTCALPIWICDVVGARDNRIEEFLYNVVCGGTNISVIAIRDSCAVWAPDGKSHLGPTLIIFSDDKAR